MIRNYFVIGWGRVQIFVLVDSLRIYLYIVYSRYRRTYICLYICTRVRTQERFGTFVIGTKIRDVCILQVYYIYSMVYMYVFACYYTDSWNIWIHTIFIWCAEIEIYHHTHTSHIHIRDTPMGCLVRAKYDMKYFNHPHTLPTLNARTPARTRTHTRGPRVRRLTRAVVTHTHTITTHAHAPTRRHRRFIGRIWRQQRGCASRAAIYIPSVTIISLLKKNHILTTSVFLLEKKKMCKKEVHIINSAIYCRAGRERGVVKMAEEIKFCVFVIEIHKMSVCQGE